VPQSCGDGQVQSCAEQCDDGNTVNGDGCSSTCVLEGAAGCQTAPLPGCHQPFPAGSSLLVKNKMPDTRDLLVWKVSKGDSTPLSDFGDPLSTTSYRLCVYDATQSLVAAMAAPAGGSCPIRACWKATSRGFTYVDKEGTPGGLTKITLREGASTGVAKLGVKGKGALLGPPPLPAAQPVMVQLQNSAGKCWEARYSAPAIVSTGEQFKDKAD
jgi:cysteine-rich repeat protein